MNPMETYLAATVDSDDLREASQLRTYGGNLLQLI